MLSDLHSNGLFELLTDELVLMELQQSRAWSDDGPEFVIAAAQKRQQQEGWDAVKPALAITVR